MLVLTRRTDDRILLSCGVEIVIVNCVGSTVRVGIVAPKRVKVMRSELPQADIARDLWAIPRVENSDANLLRKAQ